MFLATYATFEEMHGEISSADELIGRLRPYSRDSVLTLSSYIGIALKLWDRGPYVLERSDQLISAAFDFLRGDWYKLAARLPEPQFVFHRRQLLLIAKLAALYCPAVGANIWHAPPGYFGTILLMANDRFHYGLFGDAGISEVDKLKRAFTEFISVGEGAGFRPEHKMVRTHVLRRHAAQLRGHPDFIDIEAEFQNATGVSIPDYEALCFALFAKYATLSDSALQSGPSALATTIRNFSAMAISNESTVHFLKDITTTPEALKARIRQRDYGSNDFTELRKTPLVSTNVGYIPTDILFLAEKFETGPYWVISDRSKRQGDRLHRFWGAVFEAYMQDVMRNTLSGTGAQFIPDPRDIHNPSRQICDALIVIGDALVILEYKSCMFRADTKYSGDYLSLIDELERKLVRDQAERSKKGVEQLADAVASLFADKTRIVVDGLDVSRVSRVYPLLITLDSIGGSLLISRLLNEYFEIFMKDRKVDQISIRPMLCADVEQIEEISACFQSMNLPGFIDFWLSKDPNFTATLTAFTVPELEGKGNVRLGEEWRSLGAEISARSFPEEYAAAQALKASRLSTS